MCMKGWDSFYQKEWTLDDVNDIEKVGTYELFE